MILIHTRSLTSLTICFNLQIVLIELWNVDNRQFSWYCYIVCICIINVQKYYIIVVAVDLSLSPYAFCLSECPCRWQCSICSFFFFLFLCAPISYPCPQFKQIYNIRTHNRAFILFSKMRKCEYKIGCLIDCYNRLRFTLKMMHAFCIDVQFK